jgi:hypothetical protein
MCRKRAALRVLEMRLGVLINLVYCYKCRKFFRNRVKGGRGIAICIFEINNVSRAIGTLIYIEKWFHVHKN